MVKKTNNKIPLIYEVLGWYGTIIILLSYILVSYNILLGTSLTYQLMNFTGAVGLGLIAYKKSVYQSVVLNIIWGIIGIIAIITIFLK